MKYILLLIVCLFYMNASFSQSRESLWYFGFKAGLDFSHGNPYAITDGELHTREGCASICDGFGNLLFYTEGDTVWNKNHSVMNNGTGLLGDISTTQSAIIIKKPGLNNVYYIFTIDVEGGPKGLRYSEVDMDLFAGLGGITGNKNIPLLHPTVEKLISVSHSNGIDKWIITHGFKNSDAFYSFLVTSAGVNDVPVISHTGPFVGTHIFDASGQMKASVDGEHIAVTYSHTFNDVQLFSFDAASGVLYDPVRVSNNYLGRGPFGLEFSISGDVLYVTNKVSINKSALYQYDLRAPNIASSEVNLYTTSSSLYGLQLGPDGRIYVAIYRTDIVGVINHPEILGMSCDFVYEGIHLKGRKCIIGLPYFDYSNQFFFKNTCLGDSTEFTQALSFYDSLYWNFGDPSSGVYNTSTSSNPSHQFTSPGNYIVHLVWYYGGVPDTIVKPVNINYEVDLGMDTAFCAGQTYLLDAYAPDLTYQWQDGSTDSIFIVQEEGDYWVEVSSFGCSSRDSISVSMNALPPIDLGTDTTICEYDSLVLDAGSGYAHYLWYTGDSNQFHTVFTQGEYLVEITDNNGCVNTDGIMIETLSCETATIYLPNAFSPNGDGLNDVFKAESFNIEHFTMYIYDRWGQKIFQSSDINNGWDGTFKGKKCPSAAYTWLLYYNGMNIPENIQKTGVVLLTR